jgi:hypothetical protein
VTDAGRANFRAANRGRRDAAAGRDVTAARWALALASADEWPPGWPGAWHAVAIARVAHPEDNWAQVGARLGWTKDRAVGCMRRLRQAIEEDNNG